MHADFRIGLATCLTILVAISPIQAFYIPGWSIRSYLDDQAIPLHVNKVYSDKTQLQFAYYELPFVLPPTGKKHAGYASGRAVPLNLGEVLRGDRIMTSDYDIAMNQDQDCVFLGTHKADRSGVIRARELIDHGYVAEWILDNLPGATSFVTVDKSHKYYAAGFKLGDKDISPVTAKPRYFLNNHHTFVIRWRKARGRAGDRGAKVIVGFEVYPKSIEAGHRTSNGCPQDVHGDNEGLEIYLAHNSTLAGKYPDSSYIPEENDSEDDSMFAIPYSYSVYFREEEKVEWSKRWDLYFNNQEEGTGIHWLAIANSLIICSLLSAVVVMIVHRTMFADGKGQLKEEEGRTRLRKKKSKASLKSPRADGKGSLLEQEGDTENIDISSDEESIDDITGWKLLHGDVFRPPPYAGFLAPLIGSGMQLVFMATSLLVLSCVGLLNPSFRGGFASVGMGLFIFAGVFSGYFSARVYKTFNGLNWRKNTLITALLFPGLLFSMIFILNLFVWAQASSTALPFGTLVGLAFLWLFIQLPLVYVGSWYGYHNSPAYEHPTKTSSIPRQIPEQAWYTKSIYAILLAGLVPFAVIFIELLFLFRNLWQDKSGYYYVFGFLTFVSAINIITVMEVTIVATYIQLCAENYRWWWQSVFIGAGSAFWVFLYCVHFYYSKLNIQGFMSGLLFFSYSALACSVYGLLTGTVGFLTAYAFVRRIYGAIKAD